MKATMGLVKKTVHNEIRYFKDDFFFKIDGAAIQNCYECIRGCCFRENKYKRHFLMNTHLFNFTQMRSMAECEFLPYKFAEETNHKICLICEDFCNQVCFL